MKTFILADLNRHAVFFTYFRPVPQNLFLHLFYIVKNKTQMYYPISQAKIRVFCFGCLRRCYITHSHHTHISLNHPALWVTARQRSNARQEVGTCGRTPTGLLNTCPHTHVRQSPAVPPLTLSFQKQETLAHPVNTDWQVRQSAFSSLLQSSPCSVCLSSSLSPLPCVFYSFSPISVSCFHLFLSLNSTPLPFLSLLSSPVRLQAQGWTHLSGSERGWSDGETPVSGR